MQLVLTPLFAPVIYGFSRPLQSATHAAWQIPLCTAVTEAIFSPLHLLMHRSRWLYRHVHALHHSRKPYIGMCALYATGAEHLLLNMLPPVVAILVARCNTLVACAWVAAATCNTVWVHSGDGRHRVHHIDPSLNYGVALNLLDKHVTHTFRDS